LRSESLAEAARGDIPARFARILASELSPDGRTAFVLLGTNEEPYLYPYVVICSREEDGWEGGSGMSFGGIGWSSIGPRDDTGVLFFGGDAPAGAAEAVVRYRGEERCVPVTSGFFVFVAWNVADDDRREPVLVRFVGREA
jgi:hypothetical protein